MAAALCHPRAIFFDMDGTLTKPMLDFDAIRAEIGIAGPILEALAKMNDLELTRANEILDRHERAAAEASELNEGCEMLLDHIAARWLPTALITRNSRASVDIVLAKHGLSFDVLICRDVAPPKPDPRSIYTACTRLDVVAEQCWMVGDGSHDIEAGNAAGTPTIWISHGRLKDFRTEPCLTLTSLIELLPIVEDALA